MENDVLEDVAAVIAVLSVESVWVRPLEKAPADRDAATPRLVVSQKAIDRHERFFDPSGDHMTLLNVFDAFCRIPTHRRQAWCRENYLQYRWACPLQAPRTANGTVGDCPRLGTSSSNCWTSCGHSTFLAEDSGKGRPTVIAVDRLRAPG